MAVADTRKLAEIVQRNCTVKMSDVLAVIAELVEVMKDQMQDSKRVKLDGFGSFKIGIESKGAETAAKFTVAEHVKGLHVVFTPERSTDPSGSHSKQFLQGCKVEELPLNTVVKDEP
jgi:predicted histone-like DNA-binding protein